MRGVPVVHWDTVVHPDDVQARTKTAAVSVKLSLFQVGLERYLRKRIELLGEFNAILLRLFCQRIWVPEPEEVLSHGLVVRLGDWRTVLRLQSELCPVSGAWDRMVGMEVRDAPSGCGF